MIIDLSNLPQYTTRPVVIKDYNTGLWLPAKMVAAGCDGGKNPEVLSDIFFVLSYELDELGTLEAVRNGSDLGKSWNFVDMQPIDINPVKVLDMREEMAKHAEELDWKVNPDAPPFQIRPPTDAETRRPWDYVEPLKKDDRKLIADAWVRFACESIKISDHVGHSTEAMSDTIDALTDRFAFYLSKL